jgi:hypothetical protein
MLILSLERHFPHRPPRGAMHANGTINYDEFSYSWKLGG